MRPFIFSLYSGNIRANRSETPQFSNCTKKVDKATERKDNFFPSLYCAFNICAIMIVKNKGLSADILS